MVVATQGVLVTWYKFLLHMVNLSDAAMKQFILFLDQQYKFGLIDLDETHVFLYKSDKKVIDLIQQRIDELQDNNTYEISHLEERDGLFRVNVN